MHRQLCLRLVRAKSMDESLVFMRQLMKLQQESLRQTFDLLKELTEFSQVAQETKQDEEDKSDGG